MIRIVPLLLIIVLAGCATTDGEERAEFYPIPGSRDLPFSEAVRADDFLFLSGQIGTDPNSDTVRLVPGGIQPETRRVLDHIRDILERHGATTDDVVKVTVILADIAEWPAMNEVYVEYFPRNKPARSAFAATGLAFGARVEIEVIAYVGDDD